MTISFQSMIKYIRPFFIKLQDFLLRWRVALFIAATVWIFSFELVEHPDYRTEGTAYFFKEVTIYISLIIMVMVLFELTLRANKTKNQIIKIIDARNNLGMQLATAKDWDEVVARILQYPSTIRPVLATSLLLYYQAMDNFSMHKSWVNPEHDLKIPAQSISRVSSCSNDKSALTPNIHLVEYPGLTDSPGQEFTTYHIPLIYGKTPVGLLNIHLQKQQLMEKEQIQLFSNTAEDMAISLQTARQRQQQHAIEVTNAATTERLEIARDLHDTLGQNLGYMHLKLDQLLLEKKDQVIKTRAAEIQRLRDIANESYELIRNTLIILHDHESHQIGELFTAHAELVANRTGITIKVTEDGQPHSLPPDYLKQLLFAYKETLTNIEKHSGADQVNVNLSWSDKQLMVSISDNGRGFVPDNATLHGHYGLNIISDRIKTLGGEVEINSELEKGTMIIFRLPINKSD